MIVSRRELFKRFGQSTLCLAVSDLFGLKGAAAQSTGAAAGAIQEYDYRKWEDLYRKQWSWDKIVHSSHLVGCIAQCEWSVFVKDGVAFKEEQIEHPRSTNPEYPDPGPQGCQRGACYTKQMYAPDRIKYPLKRVGKRGEGKWMRISWDQALTETADAILDAIIKDHGAHSIVIDHGDQTANAWRRLLSFLHPIEPDNCANVADPQMGYYATFGTDGIGELPHRCNLFDADLIFIWNWNPIYTFIPYYKEISQARYRGAQVITIAPDLSPSTVHADYWIPVEPGSDVALALGMCQVIIEEKLYKPKLVQEQTDLPFLAREDTQKFLRESDIKTGGREDQFYVYDLNSKRVVPARRDSLELGSVEPALEGRYEAELASGKKVAVRPVFDRFKEILDKNYKPEMAAELISRPFAKVHPDVIREIARKTCKAKAMLMTTRYNSSKYYHVDLIQRATALFLVLSGHARPGGPPGRFWNPKGSSAVLWGAMRSLESPDLEAAVAAYHRENALAEEVMRKEPGTTLAMAHRELDLQRKKSQTATPGWQWMYYRAGFADHWNNKQWHDPHYREFSSYAEEANKKGWFDGFIGPDKEKTPVRDRLLISTGGNYLRRLPGSQVLYDKYTPSLEKIISADLRMSTTTLHADLVLPCAGYYEKTEVRSNVHFLIDKAVDPPGEAKSDWDICCLLAKKIGERAKQRGVTRVYDASRATTLELDKLYDRFTMNGAFKEGEEEKIADFQYRLAGKIGLHPAGLNLEQVRKTNGIPASMPASPSDPPAPFGNTTAAYRFTISSAPWPSDTRPPFGGAADKDKYIYPTLTRRAQFYLDHDWYVEAGEALPVHRPNPLLGGDYPFYQTGGHGRESIHTVWITNPLILRLTRGVPSLLMNQQAAEQLGIQDYEEVEVYNDAGLYRVRVKHSALVRPNQVIIYHCWEKYQLSKGHWQAVQPCLAKPLLLGGGYGHLTYTAGNWQPEVPRRAARVNIRKITT